MSEKPQFKTIDEYIASFPPDIQERLIKLRETINGAAPDAQERMSWQMPTFHLRENLVHFAAQKHHIGFYPTPAAIEAFSGQLAGYKTTKGGVQFPYAKPIPYGLVEEITRFRVQQVAGK